ncbi:hypothetical protein NGM10_00630 [Halorussus salilacus]|uniref:hypothetical protein n=1 Tax=Halorussus salilacus TaxID=2953750 RepID=UPI0020A06F13|nr:hypothetical protein [Halorussus salilacus]USZ68262.1 hypothetical protein NGM10_00630 [Halorussus salilacus]
MSMVTYTLVVSEGDERAGITGDVYNDGGTIEESVYIDYRDHGLAPRGEGDSDERRRQTTADVTTLNLDVARDDGGFAFRLLADGDRELLTERVSDDDWGLGEA